MNKQLSIVGLLTFFLVGTTAYSQKSKVKEIELEEVVISATKFKLKKEKVGKVIHKITQEEIQNNAGRTVLELLNAIPGIEIKGSNSVLGEVKGTYIRGGRNRQVLVLIDGVPLTDPTGISLEYDLRLLSLNQIESIEIMKGASSTMYGSGATTGVINIVLKKASTNAISGTYQVSLGTNNSAISKNKSLLDKNQTATIRGTVNNFNYLTSLSFTAVDGLSAAKSNTNQEFTTDPFYSENGLVKLGYDFSDKLNIESFFNIDNLEYSFDAGTNNDSKTNQATQKQLRIGIKPNYTYKNGNVVAIASLNRVKRILFDDTFEGNSTNIEVINKWDINSNTQLISGVNYQKHFNQTNSPWGNIDEDVANFNTLDVYGAVVFTTDFDLTINTGGRLNKHSNYGNHLVYHINPSLHLFTSDDTSLKLLTSYSTAFIAPSLYQLFSVYGNTNLEPETSKTAEFGFESTYKKWLEFNVVYFNRTENNAIIFQGLSVAPWGQYANSNARINAKGIESIIELKPSSEVNVAIGYTYTDKDAEADYLPKNKITAQINYKPSENVFVSLAYKNVGERTGRYYDATTFTTVEEQLPTYQLLDINANLKLLNGRVVFFGSLTNIFNEDYEETIGYTTRGRNYKLGIRLRF
ncbi:TonB-dependent receptor plug domain-containing protein [Polaribacter uvawellassae]|uniref:TonB-dependent receptor plug domain-containing protein n=1 Tax=Polaribacter uvawellassae TaxID=3133495 RepID=UPI00321BF6C0